MLVLLHVHVCFLMIYEYNQCFNSVLDQMLIVQPALHLQLLVELLIQINIIQFMVDFVC